MSHILEQIIDRYPDESFLKADGFDEAIIGLAEPTRRLVYSVSKCIAILEFDHNMTRTEAKEYLYFNVCEAHIGEQTPIWCEDDFEL